MNGAADDDTGQAERPLLQVLSALASPYRLRIIAALMGRRQYVSELAREIGMSRPLLHMHLRKLQAAGLVTSTLELSDDGRAMNYLALAPFNLRLTPQTISEAVRTLPDHAEPAGPGLADEAEEDQ